jgi:hypothetical protein
VKKKMVYIFEIANITLLVLNGLTFTNRLYNVNYSISFDTYSLITQYFLNMQGVYAGLIPLFIIISIALTFLLEIKKAIIIGLLGFILYAVNEISIMYVSTRAFILRVFVLTFYLSIQVCLIYLTLKPKKKEIENIKRTVIDMSDKFTITTIKEISEKTKSDHDVVIKIVKNLITDGDINADLFRRSKKLAFYK